MKPFLCRLPFHFQLLLAGSDAQSILSIPRCCIEAGKSQRIKVLLCSPESSKRKYPRLFWRYFQRKLAQPLGQTVSNGSVRLSVDFRTPNKWNSNSTSGRNIRIMLAPESYYNSSNDSQQTTLYASRVGMDGTDGVNVFKFLRAGSTVTTASGGASNHWYRAVMTVDIDAKTYDTMIFDMGETSAAYNAATPADSQAVFSSSGEPLKNGQLPEISCFSLMTMI